MKHIFGKILLLGLIAVSYGTAISCAQQEPPPPGFSWDFTQKTKITYSWNVQDNHEMQMHKDSLPDLSQSTLIGKLIISSSGENIGSIAYKDIVMTSYDLNQEREITDSSSMDDLDISISGLKPNGRFEIPSLDVLWSSIIPLPNKDIKVGETSQIELQYPINNYGSQAFVGGSNTLTFIGYDTLLNRKCAVLKGEIDVTQFDMPKDWKGEFDGSLTGTGTYYFDLKDHVYVGADVQFVMKGLINPIDENGQHSNYFKFKQNETVKIRLINIE